MITPNKNQSRLIEEIVDWYRSFYSGRPSRSSHPQWYAYSGAAGTGKTTVIKVVLDILGLYAHEYCGCAYVGKAVLQLHRNKLTAKTIHSLIYDITMEAISTPGSPRPRLVLKQSLKESLPSSLKLIIVDEATMVNDEMVAQILSFGLPVIFVGDMNQLPPIFGVSSVMMRPDFILTEIMRQAENDPIVVYSQMILNGEPLRYGSLGNSSVLRLEEVDPRSLIDYTQILTTTNRRREKLNNYVRRVVKGIDTEHPILFDRMICRRNNWSISVDGFSLTNGLSGTITDINKDTLHKKAYTIDFHPDFFPPGKDFDNIEIDAEWLLASTDNKPNRIFNQYELFEYGYAITVHLSQGSEYDNVIFFDDNAFDPSTAKKARYTAITRARKKIDIVI